MSEQPSTVSGHDLRTLRGQANISLQAMADAIGCPPQELAEIELDTRPASPELATAVLKAVLSGLYSDGQ